MIPRKKNVAGISSTPLSIELASLPIPERLDVESREVTFVDMYRNSFERDVRRADMNFGREAIPCTPKFTLSEEKISQTFGYLYGSVSRFKECAANLVQGGDRSIGKMKVGTTRIVSYQIIILNMLRTKILLLDYETELPMIELGRLSRAAGKERKAVVAPTTDEKYFTADKHPYEQLILRTFQILGDDLVATPHSSTHSSIELAEHVERAWPFMGQIHRAGEFSVGLANQLMEIATIRERLASKVPLQSAERNCLLLCAQCMLSDLPLRIYLLAAIHFPELNKTLGFDYQFAGFTCSDIGPGFNIWDEAPDEVQPTIECVMLARLSGGVSENLLCTNARSVVTASSINARLNVAIEVLIDKKLRPIHEQLIQFFTLAGCSNVDVGNCVASMPTAEINVNVASISGIDRLNKLTLELLTIISTEYDSASIFEQSEQRMASIREAQDRIHELNSSRSIDAVLEIAECAERAKAIILGNQGWYQAQLEDFQAYFNKALAVIDEIKALGEAAEQKQGASDQTAATDGPADASSANNELAISADRIRMLESEIRELDDRLSTALVNNEHIASELKEKKEEIHKLRFCPQTPQAGGNNLPGPKEFDASLLNRIVMRSGVSATDVLEYYAMVAPERVVILQSAFDSAVNHTATATSIDRMFDLLHKAIFPYLDASNGGSPDSEARKVFAAKSYSAKESDTTSNNVRMGAQRDFTYQGETIRIERHLRISNGTGKDGMRIYFDIIGGKVVIAYAGPHLGVASTS